MVKRLKLRRAHPARAEAELLRDRPCHEEESRSEVCDFISHVVVSFWIDLSKKIDKIIFPVMQGEESIYMLPVASIVRSTCIVLFESPGQL